MMKNTLSVAVLAALFAMPVSAEVGLGFKAGGGHNDAPLFLPLLSTNSESSYDSVSTVIGGEVFYETNSTHRWGVKTGFNQGLKSSYHYKDNTTTEDYSYKTIEIPFTGYYKFAPENIAFSAWAGGGFSYMKTTYTSGAATSDYTQGKIVPHIDGGLEWRFAKHFGLGFNASYIFAAKFDDLRDDDNNKAYLYDNGITPMSIDKTGAAGEFVIRYYF